MRGHLPILAMRRAGLTPTMVTLSDYPTETWSWRDWPEDSAHAQVEIDAKDSLPRLDLRYVVGLTVIVDGHNANRVNALGDAAELAGASRVIRIVYRVERQRAVVGAVADSLTGESRAY
jgi:hypothetical protein